MDDPIDETSLTPMMAQYWAIKKAHKDHLLFYRMGDFYELFFKDAQVAAPILDIVLTHHSKHGNEHIPMCGVPVASVNDYLAKLVQAGFNVAICEQLESPQEAKERGYKELVRRDVVRIVTPGTLTEESLLEARKPNNLVAITSSHKGTFSLAKVDISTGQFQVESLSESELTATISRLYPKEILISSSLKEGPWGDFLAHQAALSILPESKFNPSIEAERLRKFFNVQNLLAFGEFSKSEIAACGALLEYLHLTQKEAIGPLLPPRKISSQTYVTVDAATRQNLELVRSSRGDAKNSLLSVIDKTITAQGGRLLFERLLSPIRTIKILEARLNAIDFWLSHREEHAQIIKLLKKTPDAERALGRLGFNRGSVRDLYSILETLKSFRAIRELFPNTLHPDASHSELNALSSAFSSQQAGELSSTFFILSFPTDLKDLLEKALVDSPHATASDFVASHFCEELDQCRMMRDHSKELIANLHKHYVTETGINSLKIQFNYILGWHIDVPTTQLSRVPEAFIHRQTLASSTRYTTLELQELQDNLSKAADRCNMLERQIFTDLSKAILAKDMLIKEIAQALAIVDLSQNFAHLAQEHRYVRPTFSDSPVLSIKQGRHPLVECRDPSAQKNGFIANSCHLDDFVTFVLLTGPNMAGKSTYLRQNALISLMAHMGFFVPAESAHIGIMDRVFSRIGASDDLAQGHSTFMVEMAETAAILNQATQRSFVILDEVGRGTSTFDGLSLAWAIAERLHTMRVRTLFATHYHELASLRTSLERLKCETLKVREWKDTIVFLHEVITGVSDRSYGIYVAKLAGFPHEVLIRAQEVLS
ncbi:MAG: DNA mismatch repair protein MutS, partial [Holosporales bacterium]|nr:DNA mismatch repair protein MutS [Holosporales bacterium]